MKKIYLLLITWAMVAANASAQPGKGVAVPKSLDSLQWYLRTQPRDTSYALAMKDCAYEYIIEGQQRRADSLITELEKLPTRAQNVKVDFYIFFLKATRAFHQGQKAETLEYFQQAMRIVEAHPTRFQVSTLHSAYNNVAAAFSKLDKPDSTVHYCLKCIKLQEKHQFLESGPYTKIANFYARFRQYSRALPYYEKALAIDKAQHYDRGVAITENLLGNLMDNMNRPDEAIRYYQSGLERTRRIKYPLLETDLLVNLGLMYTARKEYDKALGYLKAGEKRCRELGTKGGLRTNLHNQGELYRDLEKFDLAEKCYQEALNIAGELADYNDLYVANQAMAELRIDQRQHQAAIPFLQAAGIAKDSVFNQEMATKTDGMLQTYQAEKRQQEIELLNQKNKSQALELTLQQRNLGLVISGSLLLGIVGFAGYRRVRLRRLLELEQVRSRIAADFHDELGANLSSIALYSDILQQSTLTDAPKTRRLTDNISHNARESIVAINDLIWAIQPDNDALGHTFVRMKAFAIPLLEARGLEFTFDLDESLHTTQLAMDTRKFIYLIFKEALNNALKYADATHLSVRLTREGRRVTLLVADNGRGFDLLNCPPGNGLGNMRQRAVGLGGHLTLTSAPGEGTTVALVFRLP